MIATMQADKVRVILVQPFQNRKTAETVARQTDGVVLDMEYFTAREDKPASYCREQVGRRSGFGS